jgi:hypothetical protein
VRYRGFDVWTFERQLGKWQALMRSTEGGVAPRQSKTPLELTTSAEANSAQDALLMAMAAIDDLQDGGEALAASRQLGHGAIARIRKSKSFTPPRA